jgi:hypothetical protein
MGFVNLQVMLGGKNYFHNCLRLNAIVLCLSSPEECWWKVKQSVLLGSIITVLVVANIKDNNFIPPNFWRKNLKKI